MTAAYLLSKNEVDVVVLEADPVYVGGISREHAEALALLDILSQMRKAVVDH